jgi:molybdopterin-binding protein
VPTTVSDAAPDGARAAARPAASSPELSLAESVCLTLITQDVSHGWALGTMLAADGDLGRIWTLSRPLTYRAIDGLVDKGLVVRRGQRAGHGRDRMILAATAAGRRAAAHWLDAPVQHLRDVRTELLVKLRLRERAALDNEPLLLQQQRVFEPTIATLTSSDPDDDLVDLWRREGARAVRRFLEEALRPRAAPASTAPELRLSARNQLHGTVTAVRHGEVMSSVKAVVREDQPLTAAITKDAAAELDLAPGDEVLVIVKATEVMVAKAS